MDRLMKKLLLISLLSAATSALAHPWSSYLQWDDPQKGSNVVKYVIFNNMVPIAEVPVTNKVTSWLLDNLRPGRMYSLSVICVGTNSQSFQSTNLMFQWGSLVPTTWTPTKINFIPKPNSSNLMSPRNLHTFELQITPRK